MCDMPWLGVSGFLFALGGPHPNGCWCHVDTKSPTRVPTTRTPSAYPTKTPSRHPVTEVPITGVPVTQAPVTSAPLTNTPVTFHPSTSSPTSAPSTDAPQTTRPSPAPATKTPSHNPTTDAPTTHPSSGGPTTCEPSENPATVSPVTVLPTPSPVTNQPTTGHPITGFPSIAPSTHPITQNPSSSSPVSLSPITTHPATSAPTEAPATHTPATAHPVSLGPSTRIPTTHSPVTVAPQTPNPTSDSPVTPAPTKSPITNHPTTVCPSQSPITDQPSEIPTTSAPTSASPITCAPTTGGPTTDGPTTSGPSTSGPSTSGPSTCGPSTSAPTTQNPTTTDPSVSPTSASPITQAPTRAPSQTPSTEGPVTACPTQTPTTCGPTTRSPTRDPTSACPTVCPTTCGPTTRSPLTRWPTYTYSPTRSPRTKHPTTTTRCPSRTPTSRGPTSQNPTTNVPTESPTSRNPTTRSPETGTPSWSPTTPNPTTRNPTTQSPTTPGPTTCGPTTCAPTTDVPTTYGPTTASPSQSPTSQGPTSDTPTTASPGTTEPSRSPTSRHPASCGPSTSHPSTHSPITSAPSESPTSRYPSTRSPTTRSPATSAPSRSPITNAPYMASLQPSASPTTPEPSVNPTEVPSCLPTSRGPTTCGPTTLGPITTHPTSNPSSSCPVTNAPTPAPASAEPTMSPSTSGPSTTSPSHTPFTRTPSSTPVTMKPTLTPSTSPKTNHPTTLTPSTAPTTAAPVSVKPTRCPATVRPSTSGPSTGSPLTITPLTISPLTNKPTTAPATTTPSVCPVTSTPATDNPSSQPTITAAPTVTCGCPYVAAQPLPPGPGGDTTVYIAGFFASARRCVTPSPATAAPSTLEPTGAPSSAAPTHAPTEKCALPSLQSATLSASGAAVAVAFAADTNQGGMENGDTNCSLVLRRATVDAMGHSPHCVWQTSGTLLASFGPNATLGLGDAVALVDGVVARPTPGCPALSNASAPLALGPEGAPTTTAIISAPAVFGACYAVELDGGDSIGSAGRSLTFKWTMLSAVEANGGGALPASVLSAMQASVDSASGALVLVDTTGLVVDALITVRLRVTNWLNQSSTTSLTVTKTSTLVPFVTVNGGTEHTVKASDLTTISTSVQPPPSGAQGGNCSQTLAVSYLWDSPSGHAGLIVSTTTADLVILPFVLSAGESYRFRLTAAYGAHASGSQINVTVHAANSIPQVIIRQCNRRVRHGDNQTTYTLDASLSFDPDHPELGFSALDYQWACQRTSGVGCVGLIMAASARLDIESAALGETNITGFEDDLYEFTLTVTNRNTSATAVATCALATRSEPAPEVWVEPPVVLSGIGEAVLSGNASGAGAGIASYQWTCQKLDGASCGFDISSSDVVLGSPDAVNLIVNKEALTGGVTYRFTLTLVPAAPARGGTTRLQNAGALAAAASGYVDINVPEGPASGSCGSTPTSGEAVTTQFRLRCSGWAGGTGLKYGFSLNDGGTTIRSPAATSSFVTTLPSPVASNKLVVTATITNDAGGTTKYSFNVTVNMLVLSAGESEALRADQALAASNAAAAGDIARASESILNALTLSGAGGADASLLDTVALLSSTAADTTQAIGQKAALVGRVTAGAASLDPSAVNKTVQILSALIGALDGNSYIDYTDEFGASVVDAIGNILNSTATSGVALSGALDKTLTGLGASIADVVSVGQPPKTVSSPNLDLSVQKFDAAVLASSGTAAVTLSHGISAGSGASSVKSDSAEVPLDVLVSLPLDSTAVFVSSGVFWPRNANLTSQTGLVSASFLSQGQEQTVQGVASGIVIIFSGVDRDANSGPSDVCQFWNTTLEDWSTNGCHGFFNETTSAFVCNCTHLTSFQGGADVAPKANTISAADIKNLTLSNILANPFTVLALTIVFFMYGLVVVASTRARRETLCCCGFCCGARARQKDKGDTGFHTHGTAAEKNKESIRAFLIQWHLQKNMGNSAEPESDAKAAGTTMQRGVFGSLVAPATRLRDPEVTGSKPGSGLSSLGVHGDGSSYQRPTNATGRHRCTHTGVGGRMNPDTLVEIARSDAGAAAAFAGSDVKMCSESPGICSRVKQCARACLVRARACCCCCRFCDAGGQSTSKDAAVAAEKDAEKDRAEKRKAAVIKKMKMALIRAGEEQEMRGVPNMAGEATEERTSGRRESPYGKVARLWWHLIKMNHLWCSVFLHKRQDPFTSVWRANVLLVALLLVMVTNGFFYGINQSSSGEIMIGLISGIVVFVMTTVLVALAKRVGYRKWEVQMCEIRDVLCRPRRGDTGGVRRRRRSSVAPALADIIAGGGQMMGAPTTHRAGGRHHVELYQTRASPAVVPTSTALAWTKPASVGGAPEIPNAAAGPTTASTASDTESVRRRVRAFQMAAWTLFLTLVMGSSFTILVLGVKFDLDDENSGSGAQIHRSRSFKWLVSCVISEAFSAVALAPFTILAKAAVLAAALSLSGAMASVLVDALVSDDDLVAVHAYDVFEAATDGYTLGPSAQKQLRELVVRARLSQRLSCSNVTLAEDVEALPMDVFGDLAQNTSSSGGDGNIDLKSSTSTFSPCTSPPGCNSTEAKITNFLTKRPAVLPAPRERKRKRSLYASGTVGGPVKGVQVKGDLKHDSGAKRRGSSIVTSAPLAPLRMLRGDVRVRRTELEGRRARRSWQRGHLAIVRVRVPAPRAFLVFGRTAASVRKAAERGAFRSDGDVTVIARVRFVAPTAHSRRFLLMASEISGEHRGYNGSYEIELVSRRAASRDTWVETLAAFREAATKRGFVF